MTDFELEDPFIRVGPLNSPLLGARNVAWLCVYMTCDLLVHELPAIGSGLALVLAQALGPVAQPSPSPGRSAVSTSMPVKIVFIRFRCEPLGFLPPLLPLPLFSPLFGVSSLAAPLLSTAVMSALLLAAPLSPRSLFALPLGVS